MNEDGSMYIKSMFKHYRQILIVDNINFSCNGSIMI